MLLPGDHRHCLLDRKESKNDYLGFKKQTKPITAMDKMVLTSKIGYWKYIKIKVLAFKEEHLRYLGLNN